MSTYVLVGGAWIGAWAWQHTARCLRSHGHTVYPASLTGLAERVHLGSPDTNLETHINDIVNLIDFEDLEDVILVGHSYAGCVIPGVADRIGPKLAALVYCDAGPLPDGKSFMDMQSLDGQATLRTIVEQKGDGWRMPFPGFPALGETASLRGLGESERELIQRKSVGHPFGTWTQPLRLIHQRPATYQQLVIVCEDGHRFLPVIRSMIPDIRALELDTGHWPMLSAPAELAALLETVR
jgi:pimeloyl-ACP methyl ester carboxylesterase